MQCGEAMLPEAAFCVKCGAQLPAAAPLTGDAQTAAAAAPAQAVITAAPPGLVDPYAPAKVTEKYIWGLACAPFVGSKVAGFTVGAVFGFIHEGVNEAWLADYNAVFPWAQLVLCLILNIFFLSKDMDEIKKTGKDAESWMWMGLLLVPVYIGVRESKTNKNYWPLIVNLVLLFFM